MPGFSIYNDSKVLKEEQAGTVVKQAMDRLQRKRVHGLIGSTCPNTATLRHDDIELGPHIGNGSFASVFQVKKIHFSSQQEHCQPHKLAVKVLRPKLAGHPSHLASSGADLYKEALIMAQLNHKNVLKLHAWEPSGIFGYVNGRHDAFFLVIDRLDETLGERIGQWNQEKKRISRSLVDRATSRQKLLTEQVDAVSQLSAAVRYLHGQLLLHRDLKPENIGFQDGVLKIFDFDVSCVLPKADFGHDETFKLTKAGTPRYMAPEVASRAKYNLSADVYTFALLAHEILTLKKPFCEIPSHTLAQSVYADGYRPKIPNSWPLGLQTLITSGWCQEHSRRPSMSTLDKDLQTELTRWLQKETPKRRVFGPGSKTSVAPISTTPL